MFRFATIFNGAMQNAVDFNDHARSCKLATDRLRLDVCHQTILADGRVCGCLAVGDRLHVSVCCRIFTADH